MNQGLRIKNILVIDTSDNKQVRVGLKIDGKVDLVDQVLDVKRAQVVLPLIDNILQKHHLTPSDLTGIEVHTGPGSFTGLRVGITIANTLGYTLQIPINGKRVGDMVEPEYN